MRITALEIDGFGIWSGLKLDEFADGLTVIYGPNEAGKTTLMQFVRAVLYGFSPERRRYLPPVHGGQPGGSLQVTTPSGAFQVCRHLEHGTGGVEDVVLWAADGTRQGEHLLRGLLSNLDEVIFQNVFAVGLRELQELATLSDTDAAAFLYNLSAGLDRVALVDVMRELEQSRNRLLDPGGGSCQIVQLLAEREKFRGEEEHSQTSIRRYERLLAERDQLHREAARLGDENTALQRELRVLEIALTVRQRWLQRVELDERLSGTASLGALPEDALERLDTIRGRIGRRQQRLEQLKLDAQELREERSGLKPNDALVRLAPRIEALQDQADWLVSLENRLVELEVETSEIDDQLKAHCQQFGLGKPDRPESLPDISDRSLKSLRQPASAVSRAHARLKQSKREVGQSREAEQSLAGQIESALRQRGESDLTAAIERTSGLVGLLRRRVQLDERLEQMEQYHAELDQQSQGLLDEQLLPGWTLAILGCLFITGPVLALLKIIGLMVSTALTDPLQWWHVVVGLAATGGSVAAKAALERMNSRRLDACHRQIGMLESQRKQSRDERENLDRQLPRGGGPILVRLQAAERELAALEEIVPLDSRRQAARQDAQNASDRVREAKHELSSVRRRWRDSLAMLGLPQELMPKQVRQLAASAGRVRELAERRTRLREESQQRQRELDGLCGRIRQLVADAALDLEKQSPQEQLQALGDQLRQHEAARKRLDAIRTRFKQLRRKRARCEAGLQKLKTQRRRLLHEVGAEDEQEFRRRATQLKEVSSLRRDRAALDREIEAAIGNQCSEDEIRKTLQQATVEQLDSRRQQVQQQLASRQAEIQTRFEKSGQVAEQLRLMAEDRQPGAWRLQQSIVQRRLEEAIQRWRSLAVTCRILQTVRTIYERDRQPETLKEASQYLDRMTDGRYSRVWTPLGESVLKVDDHEGRSLPVEVLSQGTREQLFLCLRLALTNSYGRRGIQMPLILDDVLVNFDVRRAKAAAAVLSDFAATQHQVIIFTCHEHIMKLFQALKVTVRQLPDRDALPAPEQKRKSRRRSATPTAPAKPVKPTKPRKPVEPDPIDEPDEPQVEPMAPWEESEDDSEQTPQNVEDEEEFDEEEDVDEEDEDEDVDQDEDEDSDEDLFADSDDESNDLDEEEDEYDEDSESDDEFDEEEDFSDEGEDEEEVEDQEELDDDEDDDAEAA